MFYMLLTTPRVGSNLLCSLLGQMPMCGKPKEFLNPMLSTGFLSPEQGFGTLEQVRADINGYVRALRERYTSDGCFGMKIQFRQFRWALAEGLDMQEHFPDRFLFMTRGDLVGQAISMVRACQTGSWHDSEETTGEPAFSAEDIDCILRGLVSENNSWESFFAEAGIRPLRISYERLVGQKADTLRSISNYLGVAAEADIEGIVERSENVFKVQRDGLTEQWRQGYEQFLRQTASETRATMTA